MAINIERMFTAAVNFMDVQQRKCKNHDVSFVKFKIRIVVISGE